MQKTLSKKGEKDIKVMMQSLHSTTHKYTMVGAMSMRGHSKQTVCMLPRIKWKIEPCVA